MPNNNVKNFKKNLDVLEGQEKKEFLKGAEIAYETILTSFAKGDIQKLKSLLTPDMATNFEQAIQVRNKENIKSEFTFIGVKESNVVKFLCFSILFVLKPRVPIKPVFFFWIVYFNFLVLII